jgi:hypothetical protein
MRLGGGLRPPGNLSGGRRATALGPGPLPALLRVRELASPFFAKRTQMSSAGLGNPPQSPPGRARRCALAGGYMRREQPEQPEQPGKASLATRPSRGEGGRLAARLPLWWWARAREPIFCKTHPNEFCGIGKSTPEPAGPCASLRPGRWVYEKGKESPAGRMWWLAIAPLRGSLRRPLSVPFHTSPLSRGALRSAGVPTIAASTTPAPLLPWRSRRAPLRHLGRLCRRKGIPRVRRGVGYVGAWRFARPLKSHRGYLPVGDALGRNLQVGPPLGALRRCLRGANAPRSRLPTALWGIQEGKADVTRGETGAQPDEQRGHAGPSARRPVT